MGYLTLNSYIKYKLLKFKLIKFKLLKYRIILIMEKYVND